MPPLYNKLKHKIKMANCNLYSSGWSLADNCYEGMVGGVKEFYITNYSASTTFSTSSDGTITGGTALTLYKIEQDNEKGSFNWEHTKTENKANIYTINAEMTFYRYQAALRDFVLTMHNSYAHIVALTNEGTYILLGEDSGMEVNTSNGGVGKTMEDLNGVIIPWIGKSKSLPREISSTHFGTYTIV